MTKETSGHKESPGYNERLYKGGFRKWLHTIRFRVVAAEMARLPYDSVFELGCFDGKLLNFLPRLPAVYIGADAGWEGGLALGRRNFPQFQFIQAQSAADLEGLPQVDVCVCMDTLEHIPPALVGPYLEAVAAITRKAFIVTVPVEFGPIFFAKYMVKRLVRKLGDGDGELRSFTAAEVLYSSLGMTSRVRRGEHKGFDYRALRRDLEKHFTVTRAEGHPFAWAPGWLNFGYGLVCVPKPA